MHFLGGGAGFGRDGCEEGGYGCCAGEGASGVGIDEDCISLVFRAFRAVIEFVPVASAPLGDFWIMPTLRSPPFYELLLLFERAEWWRLEYLRS